MLNSVSISIKIENEETLLKKRDHFQIIYSDIIGLNFSLQFLIVYNLILPELTNTCTVYQLSTDILNKFGVFEYDIIEIYRVMLLFYTILVTSVEA